MSDLNRSDSYSEAPKTDNDKSLARLMDLWCTVTKKNWLYLITAPEWFVMYFYDEMNHEQWTKGRYAKDLISVSSRPDKYRRYIIKNTTYDKDLERDIIEECYILPEEGHEKTLGKIYGDLEWLLSEIMPNHLADNQEYFNFLVNNYNNESIVDNDKLATVKEQIKKYMNNRGYILQDRFTMEANTGRLWTTIDNTYYPKTPGFRIPGEFFIPKRDGSCYILFGEKPIPDSRFVRCIEENKDQLPTAQEMKDYLQTETWDNLLKIEWEWDSLTFSLSWSLMGYASSWTEGAPFIIKNWWIYSKNLWQYFSWEEFKEHIQARKDYKEKYW